SGGSGRRSRGGGAGLCGGRRLGGSRGRIGGWTRRRGISRTDARGRLLEQDLQDPRLRRPDAAVYRVRAGLSLRLGGPEPLRREALERDRDRPRAGLAAREGKLEPGLEPRQARDARCLAPGRGHPARRRRPGRPLGRSERANASTAFARFLSPTPPPLQTCVSSRSSSTPRRTTVTLSVPPEAFAAATSARQVSCSDLPLPR